jgi:acetolactate synthase-1/2/3 large subunit
LAKLKGYQIFWECLLKEGVDLVFGYPGGAVINLYDELMNYPQIRHVLTRHEQGAVHAADGYARSTGKPGVAIVTSGPGATNTVTGIATAYMDSSPVVVFTGQVPTVLIGNDAFQEADIVGITRPCTKHNYLVKSTADLARTIREAFYIATSGRPGPVLVDMPKDVVVGEAEFEYPEKVTVRGYHPGVKGHAQQVKKAAQLIAQSRRPLIYAGGGVVASGAHHELRELAETIHAPVTLTLMGLGGFPGDHPLFLGMLGMHGTYVANMAISHCDLIIAVGARFDDRVTGKLDAFATRARMESEGGLGIIHIDMDPTSISKNVEVGIPIVGDAKNIIHQLLESLGPMETDWESSHKDWLEQLKEWDACHPLQYNYSDKVIKPQYVMEKLYEITNGEAIITTEVGQNQMWAALFYRYKKPRQFITSGGLGTMGFGFPAAIGAQLGNPDSLVIDIAGDGSFQMNIQELATVAQYNVPIKVLILNNGFLGMVRQWQELFFDRKYSQTDISVQPDFVKVAEAYGIKSCRIDDPKDVESLLKELVSEKGAMVADVVVDREECVFPMVPAGAAISNMLLEKPKLPKNGEELKRLLPLNFPS